MSSSAYQRASQQFAANDEQRVAYESTGNFIVLAGPGSGKTKVLTTKFARIAYEDVKAPRGAACVTYSNECARELKRRLNPLGVQSSGRIFVGTVHAFCFQNIVRPFAKLAGLDIGSPIRVATDHETEVCFAKGVAKVISSDENPRTWSVRCTKYRRVHLDRDAEDWYGADEQAALIIEEHERQLRRSGLIDYDDMMLLGLRLVERHRWVRRALRAKFPVVVVDEYQDLGVPLHRIVLNLCFRHDEPNSRLFAVGDPDQSIYGFTGAKPELLRRLAIRPDVESVTLKLNYRSRQSIIAASEIAIGEARGYRANNDAVGVVDFHLCRKGLEHQARSIVDALIPEVLESGVASSLGEIAVLYRTKNEGDVIAQQAAVAGTEFVRIDGNGAYPKTPLTRWLEDCAAWCDTNRQDESLSLRAIVSDYLSFNRTLTSERNRLEAVHDLVACLRNLGVGDMPFRSWLSALSASCLRSHLSADPTMQQETKTLDNLLAACGSGGKLEDWTAARFGGQGGTPNHLNLMTLHSSKGLEFDIVFLFGMDQGIIPGYKETSVDSKREPRRLFYVGLTRARHEVHVTFSGWRATPWGSKKKDGVSEFVVELQRKLGEVAH
ncbi:ATP-dependent helicase [Alienimonas sp. DA493]|uniref:ATP-dependent helicase n=1 Tax=Alienimonas sp. DA493 TaxID=3373605 RepID=UPI003755073F